MDSDSSFSSGSSSENNVGNGAFFLPSSCVDLDFEVFCGFFWMQGTVCVCAQPPSSGMSEGDTDRMVTSSFSF